MKSVYVETSIISYLTSRPSRDLRAAAWQEVTAQWWARERPKYELFTSELVVVEASAGDETAAARRLDALKGIPELPIGRGDRGSRSEAYRGGRRPRDRSGRCCPHRCGYGPGRRFPADMELPSH